MSDELARANNKLLMDTEWLLAMYRWFGADQDCALAAELLKEIRKYLREQGLNP